jgi:hypothetical protein
MHTLVPLLFLLAQPFWETRPPEKWSYLEIGNMRTNSPWAQAVGPQPVVLVYFATAQPIEDAEGELRLRSRNTLHEPDADYLTFMSENREKVIVLAIPYKSLAGLGKEAEEKKMAEESEMAVGKRKYKIVGHFPPVPSDPVLRLVFPREIQPTDKRVVFRLYLPGIDFPDREVEFSVKDMMYQGKLAM